MTTTTKAGFTAKNDNGVKVYARCIGRNHNDAALLGTCDGCGMPVAKTETGRTLDLTYSRNYAPQVACWSQGHECDPEVAQAYATVQADKVDSGELIKGQTVTVVKGRKVAKGTTGVVFWIGEDSWGKGRIGFKDESGETFWTATSNVEVTA